MFGRKRKEKHTIQEYKEIIVRAICDALGIDEEPTSCVMNKHLIDIRYVRGDLNSRNVPISVNISYYPKGGLLKPMVVFDSKLPEDINMNKVLFEFGKKTEDFALKPSYINNCDNTVSVILQYEYLLGADINYLRECVINALKDLRSIEFDTAADQLIRFIEANKIDIALA